MPITRKPKVKDIDVDALINKGGSVARAKEQETKEESSVLLRVPTSILERIDTTRKARPIRTPRNTWMLEALLEKLKRESA